MSMNHTGTAKRPARILKMVGNNYIWRDKRTDEMVVIIEVKPTRKKFRYFIIVQYASGRERMIPPRVFWLDYYKEVPTVD